MPNYRRFFVPGGTYFFTLVSFQRRPLFAGSEAVARLREAAAAAQREAPFQFLAAVVLPDHMHFLWTLPPGDTKYSRRIGRIKVHFTRSCPDRLAGEKLSPSRRRHRESDIWQRRFWEHSVRDEEELDAFLDYIHYNPVKHGWASCPHAWAATSFLHWVARGRYEPRWGCSCRGVHAPLPRILAVEDKAGEP